MAILPVGSEPSIYTVLLPDVIMHGFFLYMSNHLEVLAKKLAEIVAEPLDSPFTPEIVVVHSKGMERWISLELARHNGICANTIYPFPNTWLKSLFRSFDPGLPETSLFDVDAMMFKIMDFLSDSTGRKGFDDINHYLTGDDDLIRRYQLAQKIAETFDQYLTFRPNMILAWEKGEENNWQAKLWRALFAGSEHLHRVGLRERLFQQLASGNVSEDVLPRRISVFGASYLPLFHLEVLAKLSEVIEVHFLVMNPCREYWSDIVSDREIQQIKKQYGDSTLSEKDLFLYRGNPLLSSLGSMGREFFSVISDIEGSVVELFDEQSIHQDDTLSAVQSDILLLRDRTSEKTEDSPFHNTENINITNTISFHSCHSPMREIEVLHDYLLSFFEEDPELQPNDVVVMTPDIESYAPFISAVFEGQADESMKIPFSISDQGLEKNNMIMKGFMSILDFAGSRFGSSQVMALLNAAGVKEQFGIQDKEVAIIEGWVRDTHIRWGIDEKHRKALGFYGGKENTWRAGFERLLLGYAMPGYQRRLVSGILPYDNIEGGETAILGKFLEFAEQLFEAAESLTLKRSLSEWTRILTDILNRFFAQTDEMESDRRILLETFDRLALLGEISGFDGDIGLEVIQTFMKHHFSREDSGSGFISGGVTFCAMLPLRSIPAKIICLIGMNSDAFPRDYHLPGFDLLASDPKPGDRIRRNDDKYLFLQALVSARKKMYISYVGQSNRDNSQSPPSVVVSDLMDYLKKGFDLNEGDILTRHRLQPFSDEYFISDSSLFSYSKEDFDACMSAHERKKKPIPLKSFISAPLPPPDPELLDIDVRQLVSFFANPSKFLLQHRLSVYLEDELPGFEDHEPFSLNGLDRYQLEQDLLKAGYEGIDEKTAYLIQKNTGRMPHGRIADVLYTEMRKKIDSFVKRLHTFEGDGNPETIEIDLNINGVSLTGILTDIYPDHMLRVIYADTRPKYLLEAWIYHLVMSMTPKTVDPKPTLLLCKDTSWIFSTVNNSEEIMLSLTSEFLKGLRQPLVFFPRSSFEYTDQVLTKGKSDALALKAAKAKWLGNDYAYGERQDPYFQLCFSKINTDEVFSGVEFAKTAETIFAPLITNCKKWDDDALS